MSSTAVDEPIPMPAAGRRRRLVALPALVVLADWLLYGHAPGLSVALFLLALAGTALAMAPALADPRALLRAGAVLLVALVPVVHGATQAAIVLGAVATAYFALAAYGFGGGALVERLGRSGAMLLDGCGRILVDWFGGGPPQADARPVRVALLAGWVVPVVFGAAFLLLFRAANPLVDGWLTALAPDRWFGRLSPQRVLFWCAAVVMVWPFVRVVQPLAGRLLGRAAVALGRDLRAMLPAARWSGTVFGEAAVLRSLVLFNLMFAVQTVLDLAYLWGGLALPDGMSYASYAHRGAYPLVATALLAAVFVLVAMRPGSPTAGSPLVRPLVFVWVAQNILLVVSSVLRLDLYVAVYSLTYWRVAAFVWMLLVAAGLLLIVLRIALGRSNRWLVTMNLLALAATLYACSFVNMPALIARYNVEHSAELGGGGRPLDLGYLAELGPQAIPALDRYIAATDGAWTVEARELRERLARDAGRTLRDWQAWTLRRAALAGYLAEADAATMAWAGPNGE